MAKFELFEGPVAVKAGTTQGKPVLKIVAAGKNDKAYDPADTASVLAAIQRGMDATKLPLMKYSAYLPGLARKDDKAHLSAADLAKALAMPGAQASIRKGFYGPVLAVMLPLEQKATDRVRNQSF